MENMISVIIPVYNAERYLERCIQSVLNQTYTNLEVLLVDNGSTDLSSEILTKWEKADQRIRVFQLSKKGASAARNLALKNAAGVYAGFVDADDEIEKEMYEELLKNMLSHNAEAACCAQVYLKENGTVLFSEKISEKVLYGTDIFKQFMEFSIQGAACNKLFSMELIRKNQLSFDEDIVHNEDLLFVGKYFSFASVCVLVDRKFYHYYQHSDSATHKKDRKCIKDIATGREAARRLRSYVDCTDEGLYQAYQTYYLISVVKILLWVKDFADDEALIQLKKELRKELRVGFVWILKSRAIGANSKLLVFLTAYCYKLVQCLNIS